jgi:hypothetical protein
MARLKDGRNTGDPAGTHRQSTAVRMQDIRSKLPDELDEPQSVECAQTWAATKGMHLHARFSKPREQGALLADGQVDVPTAALQTRGEPQDMAFRPGEAAAVKDQKQARRRVHEVRV